MSEAVLDHEHKTQDEHHGHPPHLQHHFHSEEQQYDASKIGMWLFLATEILLFGGMFCAYAVYRGNHPEIFIYAHQFLDVPLGALNTVVLLFSSFTMAWAVRLAQLGKRTGLIITLIITILCGFTFMSIKYVEYKHKWEHGLLWGALYEDQELHGIHGSEASADGDAHSGEVASAGHSEEHVEEGTDASSTTTPPSGESVEIEKSKIPDAAMGPQGFVTPSEDAAHSGGHGSQGGMQVVPANVQIFFSIYFCMTGLHGLHVIIGMIAITWVLIKAIRNQITPEYFTPVDLVGLYWHVVDLIWIYLFPLLYLIH